MPLQGAFASRSFSTFPEQETEAADASKEKGKGRLGPKPFDPMRSKYSAERETKNLELKEKRQKTDERAPAFLHDELKVQSVIDTSYEVENPEDAKAEARLAKLKELEFSEEYRAKKRASDQTSLA